MDIAIVGLSSTTHDLAPFGTDWEMWGLPWDDGYWYQYDRLFEMHDLRLLKEFPEARPVNYIERLKEIDVPLYMQESYFPNVIRYPIEDVDPYINSSIGYMLAMAIMCQPNRIGIWGVDMASDDEYGYQKPNAEYLIGMARGKGIEVIIPDESPLCKFYGKGIRFGSHYPHYIERYGKLADVH